MLSFLIHTTELGSRILITFYKYNLLLGHKIEFIPAAMAGIAVKQSSGSRPWKIPLCEKQ